MKDEKLHYVVVTGIIIKNGKFLITKRSPKEKALEREIEEEVGLKVKNIRYLLSLSFIRADGIPTIIKS